MSIRTCIDKKLRQVYHFRHETYTKLAYYIPWLPPHRYVFVLTNQCNLRCKACFQNRKYKKGTLTKEQWIDLSEKLPKFSRITITGGEPLLLPSFKEIFKNIARRHQCNLITNGTLLTEEIVDLLLSFPKFKVLAVSIDGLKEDTMNIRGLSEGQWENLERILKYFVHRRDETGSCCVLEIKTLILDENANSLFKLYRYCIENLKADHHTFQLLKGSPLQHSDKACELEQIFEKSYAPTYKNFDVIVSQLEKIRHYNILNNRVAFLHPIVANLNSRIPLNDISFLNNKMFDPELFRPCKFPWSSIHVSYDGEFFPCLSVPIANIKEKLPKEILRGKVYKSFLSTIRQKGTVQACNRCGWLRPL